MRQATSSPGVGTQRRQRRAMRNVILSCLAVLVLGQLLIAALSLAALLRVGSDSAADRLSLIAGRAAGQIQAGLQLGKPLTQYFGLTMIFDRLNADIPDLQAAAVVLDDGTVLASTGPEIDAAHLLRGLQQGGRRARESVKGRLRLALPLAEPDDGRRGALIIQVNEAGLPEGTRLWDNLGFLAVVTLAAALIMAFVMRRMPVQSVAAASWVRLAVPVVIMLAAQAVYTLYTVQDFRGIWQVVIQQNARVIGEGLEKDLEKVLGLGIGLESMRGVEKPMQRAIDAFPLLGGMQLVANDGQVLAQVGVQTQQLPMVSFPLQAEPSGPALGQLQLYPDNSAMLAAVRARTLDAATIAVVAMVAAIELMLMLQVLMDRAFNPAFGVPLAANRRSSALQGNTLQPDASVSASAAPGIALDDPSRLGMVTRPVMFAFLFAMALPLGFLPLYARSLLAPGIEDGVAAMLVALPTAAEMAAGLAMALLAGRLIDRRGWLAPAAWGMALAVLGNLACAAADSLLTLSFARALAGVGYGLVWMALQGFVVNSGQARYRGRNMTALIAGLFAGHMTGAAVGGMLASQVGHRPVFLAGALMVLLAALALRALLWPYRNMAGGPVALPVAGSGGQPRLGALLRDKGYVALLVGSVVPFSIAQVGLLSYALPLYFDALGASTADVGRVIMLYGFCVIYIGPWLGRLMDGTYHWRHCIAAGGLVGSGGLLLLLWAPGLWGVTTAVFLLAVASCLAGAAHTPYILARESVQHYGAAGATGVMRAADKFGQMLGPLMVGALFAGIGMSAALVWTGVMYLAGTLLFWRMAPGDRPAERPKA